MTVSSPKAKPIYLSVVPFCWNNPWCERVKFMWGYKLHNVKQLYMLGVFLNATKSNLHWIIMCLTAQSLLTLSILSQTVIISLWLNCAWLLGHFIIMIPEWGWYRFECCFWYSQKILRGLHLYYVPKVLGV